MTKQRAPLSVGRAVETVSRLLGWTAIAEICGRSARAVSNWLDPENFPSISLDNALKLDAAFIAAGGRSSEIADAIVNELRAVSPEVAQIVIIYCHLSASDRHRLKMVLAPERRAALPWREA